MLYLPSFIKSNPGVAKRAHIKNKCYIYKNKTNIIDEKEIQKIISFVNKAKGDRKSFILPVHFFFSNARFKDKVAYILLECICDYLIVDCNCKVYVSFSNFDFGIITEGMTSSPLHLLNDIKYSNLNKFHQKFNKEIYFSHYRDIVKIEKNLDGSAASRSMQDIDSFLKYFQIDNDCRQKITEVIAELLDNALEHAESDCLIDLDVTADYNKVRINKSDSTNSKDEKFYGINIVILNFSDVLFGQKIKEKLETSKDLPERYQLILSAKENHKNYWDEKYTEDDFYIISSFQHKISGRCGSSSTGGTGLTKLIFSLEERSDAYNCYLTTENRKLLFKHEYLNYNDQNWVGFNEENDFINHPPDVNYIEKSSISIPGACFNLNFVLKREVNENVQN